MNEIFINSARAIAITGHRVLYPDFSQQKLEKKLVEFVDKGFDTFLIGMALGFDTICFQTLEKIREERNIKIIACVPCLSQDSKYSKAQSEEYKRLLSVADEKIILSKEYTPSCMQKRNEYMVDNCFAVFAYLKRDFGGTANTVKYANKKGKYIVYFE